jgi:hypothetical protein
MDPESLPVDESGLAVDEPSVPCEVASSVGEGPTVPVPSAVDPASEARDWPPDELEQPHRMTAEQKQICFVR